MRLAESGHFREVLGIDLSEGLIKEATQTAKEKGLSNIFFEQADFYSFDLKEDYYDVVLFYAALHHFKSIDLIAKRVSRALKRNGLIILYEYTGKNRLQFSKNQISEMNRLLDIIPSRYKKRYLTSYTKKMVYAPGVFRMIASDPSEAVESESIIPLIHREFEVLEEKGTGRDLLMMVLKDIAHHFITDDLEAKRILKRLFEEEDNYLMNIEIPDFIFGVYRKKS